MLLALPVALRQSPPFVAVPMFVALLMPWQQMLVASQKFVALQTCVVVPMVVALQMAWQQMVVAVQMFVAMQNIVVALPMSVVLQDPVTQSMLV